MDLKDFVKAVLTDLNNAVDEVRDTVNRDIKFKENDNHRTIEFDVAVTAETKSSGSGGGKVRVWHVAEGGAQKSKEKTDTIVSRVTFGLWVDPDTKQEAANKEEEKRQRNIAHKPVVRTKRSPLHVD